MPNLKYLLSGLRRRGWLFLLWTRRDIVSRYSGSVIGLVWAILQPLATIGIFYFVFSIVLQVRLPNVAGDQGYFFYLLVGLLPWLSIADGLTRSASVLVSQEQFLARTPFPIEIMPISVIVSGLLQQLIGTVFLIGLLISAEQFDPLRFVVFWPLALAAQLAISIGIGCALAMVSVHFRDTLQVVPVVTQILFYATPIIYPKTMVPEAYHSWYLFNPIACLLAVYQWIFLALPITPVVLIASLFWVLLLGLGGWLLFRILKPTLGDFL